MAEAPEKDPRVYFAAERTFLAWIRTGLGLMGVGFAVARFGLFLRQLRASEAHMPVHGTGLSVGSGVAIVLLGVVVHPRPRTHHRYVESRQSLAERRRPCWTSCFGRNWDGSVSACFTMTSGPRLGQELCIHMSSSVVRHRGSRGVEAVPVQ